MGCDSRLKLAFHAHVPDYQFLLNLLEGSLESVELLLAARHFQVVGLACRLALYEYRLRRPVKVDAGQSLYLEQALQSEEPTDELS